jgi:ribosomal protein S18 acetylase RimI-like enzyme
MTEIKIREITANELNLLEDLLYEAVYQPDETNLIPREVVNVPQVRVYIDKFGQKKDDYCLVADLNGKIIGGVWVRILADKMKGFGYVDNKTPEFAISLFKEYRNCGIGTQLMRAMLEYLKAKAYKQASLSVQKANYAVKMYQKIGFQIIEENEEDYIMLLKLTKAHSPV